MPWTPLSSRDATLQQQLVQCADHETNSPSPEEFYNSSELGLLSDTELGRWISDRLRMSSAQAPLPLPTLRDGDSYDTKDLGWLQDNAASADDKAWARREYRRILFKLWRMHVASTGETWYPPLLDDLLDRFRAITSSKRSSV
jgi:hypothetical protein